MYLKLDLRSFREKKGRPDWNFLLLDSSSSWIITKIHSLTNQELMDLWAVCYEFQSPWFQKELWGKKGAFCFPFSGLNIFRLQEHAFRSFLQLDCASSGCWSYYFRLASGGNNLYVRNALHAHFKWDGVFVNHLVRRYVELFSPACDRLNEVFSVLNCYVVCSSYYLSCRYMLDMQVDKYLRGT